MVMWILIVVALPIISLSVLFSSLLIREWIWKPWLLILACQKQGISGFPFIPFVGQLLKISKALRKPGAEHNWEELKRAKRCVEEHGKVFYFTTGRTVRICISDPDLVKDVLATNSDSYAKPSFIHVLGILGDGLFSSSGEVWARQRKLLGLAFTNKEMKDRILRAPSNEINDGKTKDNSRDQRYHGRKHPLLVGCRCLEALPRIVTKYPYRVPLLSCPAQSLALKIGRRSLKEIGNIVSIARSSLDKWLREIGSNNGELDIYHKLLQLTLNVIKKLAFGEDAPLTSNSKEESLSLITGTFDRYLHNCRELVFGPPAAVPCYRFLPTTTNREILKDQKWLFGVADELIETRSRIHASSPAETRDHNDFLNLLIGVVHNSSKELSSQQLRDNTLTILLAGHHTTASLLAWTMYMLSLQPLWQERARAEVEELCNDGEVGWAALSSMKTIAMILQETLRLFPPVPLIGRLCVRENSVGPYKIPERVEILIPTAVIHRDRDLWGKDADEWIPMRFANGISKACKNTLGYLPFGSGPRTCIGQTLAIAEAKAVLAVILPSFTWKLGPGYRHCPDISLTLLPKFDIPLIMEKLK